MSLKLCRNFLDDFDAVGAVAVDGENGVGDINMLSRWRKEVRDGRLQGRARRVDLPSRSAREIRQLQALKREHAMLKEEHELLKKRSWARVATRPHESPLSSRRALPGTVESLWHRESAKKLTWERFGTRHCCL